MNKIYVVIAISYNGGYQDTRKAFKCQDEAEKYKQQLKLLRGDDYSTYFHVEEVEYSQDN